MGVSVVGSRSHRRAVNSIGALVAPALVIILTLIVIPVYFPTNDDSLAQQIFAGSISGEPLPYVTFMGYAWCWLVSKLFTVVPGVAWWTILHLATIYISLSCFGIATLRTLDRLDRGFSPLKSFMLLLVLECGVSVPLIGRLQFTTTGSLAASTAVYVAILELLLRLRFPSTVDGSDGPDSLRFHVLPLLVPVFLMAIGYSYRPTCGYLALGFWVLVMLILIASRYSKTVLRMTRRAVIQLLLACLAVMALWMVNKVAYSSPKWKTAFERGDAYAGLTDFPATPYQEHPELYEKVGWDESLYNIASSYWFFMDPRMTTDSLEKINDVNAWGIDELVEHPFETVRSRTIEMRKPVALATVIVCTSMLIFLLRSVKDATYRSTALMTFLTAAVLLMYLFFKGRLPLRALMSVMLPSSAVLGALVLMCTPKLRPKSFAENRMQRFWLMLHGMLVLLPAVAAVCQFGYFSKDYLEQESRQANIDVFQSHAHQNPDTLFIYDYWAELTPQTIWDIDWPSNATQWGGWTYVMPWFDDVMKSQGFGGVPSTDSLLRDNVLFVNKDDFTRDLLIEDMKSLYGDDVGIDLVCMIGEGLRVYRFTLD